MSLKSLPNSLSVVNKALISEKTPYYAILIVTICNSA